MIESRPMGRTLSCERRRSRAAVRSQAGAPLSWTSERAGTLFVCERVRKAAANKRQPLRAERAKYTRSERRRSFLCERGRRRRTPSAMREQLQLGGCERRQSRAAAATQRTSQRAKQAIKQRIARRRAEEERAEAWFPLRATTKSSASRRDPQRAKRAIKHSAMHEQLQLRGAR